MNLSHHLRRVTMALVGLMALLGGLWWCVWSVAVLEYQHIIDKIIDTVRADGYQISYDDRWPFGFPNRVALRFDNLRWKNSDNIEFHAGNIDISSFPWMWRTFNAHFKRGAEVEAPLEVAGQALHLSGDEGRAHVELDENHNWKSGRIS